MWQHLHQSCSLAARFTPSLAIRGRIQMMVSLSSDCCRREVLLLISEFLQVSFGKHEGKLHVPPTVPLVCSRPLPPVVQVSSWRRGKGVNGNCYKEYFLHNKCLFTKSCAPQVYIHCNLVAWDPEVLDESKKACHYVKETGR